MVLKTVHLAANKFINRNTASFSTQCQWFSNLNVHMSFQKRLLTCRFQNSGSGVAPKILWFSSARGMLLLLHGHTEQQDSVPWVSQCGPPLNTLVSLYKKKEKVRALIRPNSIDFSSSSSRLSSNKIP